MRLPHVTPLPTTSLRRLVQYISTTLVMRISVLSQLFLAPNAALVLPKYICPGSIAPVIEFSPNWDVLGPFQIGTREAEWGADPLQFHGGFQNLTYSRSAQFKSSLAANGSVGWSNAQFSSSSTGSGSGKITVSFNSSIVDWDFLRSIYGWSGIQFQAWARGNFSIICPGDIQNATTPITDSQDVMDIPVSFHVSPTLEFFIDGKSYFGGDMYGYRRAPVVVRLSSGMQHVLDIRVTHDIRAFGGGMPPSLDIAVEAKLADANGASLVADVGGAVAPDITPESGIAGKGWASVPVRNEGIELIEIVGISAIYNNNYTASGAPSIIESTVASENIPLRLAPGQSRPLKFRITFLQPNSTTIPLLIRYRTPGASVDQISTLQTTLNLNVARSQYAPHIFTFLHPSEIVSYAALRPPSVNASCSASPDNKIPILLSLHGAGVDVHWGNAQSAYDELPDLCAWVLFPQGVTLWSGDDWHNWGWADVEAAIAGISDWIESQGWHRQGADLDKWVVTGHSNGGQGTWYALTHHSDKIVAGTPLSGYLSIGAYVPYHMWHEVDPKRNSLIQASLNSYKHELLVENFAGTPILQGHGALDDNVPTYHSRRMAQLSHEAGWDTGYLEFPGQGHWWEGVMTDGSLPEFLRYYVEQIPEIPPLPHKFSVTVANPADMGTRGGISVDQLHQYDQLGRMDVDRSGDTWVIETMNIRRWQFAKPRPGLPQPHRIVLDGQEFRVIGNRDMFLASDDGEWKHLVNNEEWIEQERNGVQLGALDAFLKSNGRFTIVLPPFTRRKPYHSDIAIEISRNLFQYFAADSEIVEELDSSSSKGNVVFLDDLHEHSLGPSAENFPIEFQESSLLARTIGGFAKRYVYEPGLGIILLRPVGADRSGIVILGADEDGFRRAARLLPLRTGVGQPNVIVLGKDAGWKGLAGARVMAMLDSRWKLSGGVL